jgi:hypothetical protein
VFRNNSFLTYFPYFEIRRSGKREREKVGGSERHYIGEGGQETVSPVLKVPRQCPLVLLV